MCLLIFCGEIHGRPPTCTPPEVKVSGVVSVTSSQHALLRFPDIEQTSLSVVSMGAEGWWWEARMEPGYSDTEAPSPPPTPPTPGMGVVKVEIPERF